MIKSTAQKYFYMLKYYVLFLLIMLISVNVSHALPKNETEQTDKKSLSTIEISSKLQLADQNRHSNSIQFKQLILELQQQPLLTKEQKYHLKILLTSDFIYTGQYDKAEKILNSLLKSDAGSLIKFRAYYFTVLVTTAKKNWLKGLQSVTSTINLLPTINSTEHYQSALKIIIIFYNQIGQYQLALRYIERLSQQELSPVNDCSLKQLSIAAKFKLKKHKISERIFEQGIKQCVIAGFKVATHFIHLYQAKQFLQEKKPEKALKLLLNNIEEAKATLYPMLVADMNNTIAKAYWQLNDIENAKIYATEALANNPNVTNLLQGVETYSLLYQVAKKQQDFPLALEYFEKYAEIEKAHLEGEKAKHLAFQLAEHNALEQESQIKLLNEQNSALAIEQALAKTEATNKKLIILSLTLIIVVLAFLGIRFWHTHKRVRQLAEYDLLTGIYNRGHFTQVTHSALKYCESAEQDLSLIMFDLDHFKKVNDDFGHACGDWALKETIKVCKDIGRKNDVFARLGGEEFCLVLPSCNIDVAMLRAEACRIAIESIITEESGHDFAITASFGVTDVKRSGFDLDTLLADADLAAYDSKKSGRNKVTVHQVPIKNAEDKLDSSWSYK